MKKDFLSRAQRAAVEFEEIFQRRPRATKLHLADSRAGHDKIPGKHKKFVWVPTEMQIRGGIHPRLLPTAVHSGLVRVGMSDEEVSRRLQVFTVLL